MLMPFCAGKKLKPNYFTERILTLLICISTEKLFNFSEPQCQH